MRKYGFKASAATIVFFMWICVLVMGQRGRYDYSNPSVLPGTLDVSGVTTITGNATGALEDYDLCIGDTTTPDYGMGQIGHGVWGVTNYNVASVDLDGTFLFRNLSGPVTGKVEFAWEEGNGNIRFALPASGVGNATYNPRSMLIVGPAPADTNMVTVGYWQTNSDIFHNLACDTDANGADLGVQNDFEVGGNIYSNDLKERTSGTGITLGNNTKVTGRIDVTGLAVHADNAAAVGGGLPVGAFYRTGGDPDLVCVVH